jgi:hypothetical protein
VEITREGADRAEKAKLRIALVQEEVGYVGANGVRFHNLVVRKLLGSPDGKALQKPGTKTAFSESVNTATLADDLSGYLDKYEKERSEKLGVFPANLAERVLSKTRFSRPALPPSQVVCQCTPAYPPRLSAGSTGCIGLHRAVLL